MREDSIRKKTYEIAVLRYSNRSEVLAKSGWVNFCLDLTRSIFSANVVRRLDEKSTYATNEVSLPVEISDVDLKTSIVLRDDRSGRSEGTHDIDFTAWGIV